MCDLRELSYAYLPAGLSEQPKIELNHVYFMQVNVTIRFSCALRSMQGMNHPFSDIKPSTADSCCASLSYFDFSGHLMSKAIFKYTERK